MNYSWVVPGTLPLAQRLAKGPQHMALREDRGAAPWRWTGQVFLPSPQLVGGALCRAEPSHACGSCPMPGGTLP